MKTGRLSAFFVFLGGQIPTALSRKIELSGERIALGSFFRQQGFTFCIVPNRFEIIKLALNEFSHNFVYLEFGVAQGVITSLVSEQTQGKSVEIHGFDTFEGLHHPHNEYVGKQSFTNMGRTPNINDNRIEWHVGYFEDTFFGNEKYLSKQKFIVLDCDLYTSTNEVLKKLTPNLIAGDLIYFDDLHVPNQERLALLEFIRSGVRIEAVTRSREGRSALFRILGPSIES